MQSAVIVFLSIVPEYDVITPFQADQKGRFLSLDLDVHAMEKRGTKEPNALFYNVDAFDIPLHLSLTKYNDLAAPDMTIERHQNGRVITEDVPQSTFLNGHVRSIQGSSVAVSNDNGLVSDNVATSQPSENCDAILSQFPLSLLVRNARSIPFVRSNTSNKFQFEARI